MSDSQVLRHGPCPSCGSSDACAVYDDGHEHCFSQGCTHHTPPSDSTKAPTKRRKKSGGGASSDLIAYDPSDLPKRKLSEETCRKFNYGIGRYNGEAVQVACYMDLKGQVVGQKIRTADKDFIFLGENPGTFFGQHIWREGGKMVVVTEGEIDAMSMSQAQANKWPVLSVPTGCQGAAKTFRKNIQYLESFEKVIIMFDNDEPGRAAALECAEILSPGKAFIASLPLKDPSDMVVAGRTQELLSAMWEAKPFRPDKVINGTELWDRVANRESHPKLPYKWDSWNTLHLGAHEGEILTIVAGTGSGKSTIAREMVAHWHDHYNETVGIIALEENVEDTAAILVGLQLGKRIHLGEETVSKTELRKAFDKSVGSGRYVLLDHYGSCDGEELIAKMRYMVKGCGCKTILLDHISMAVSGSEDERSAIDAAMANFRRFVEETRIRLVLICHLSRGKNFDPENGDQIQLRNIRGSNGVAQVSNRIVALERKTQCEKTGHLTRVRWLKDRKTGRVGVCGWLAYDTNTGRSADADPPEEQHEPEDTGKSDF